MRHSLQLLFHLLCKENFRSGNDNLLVVEEIVRSAIFPTETDEHFKATDEHSQPGNLKLFVYSRILALLLLQLVRQDELPLLALENDLKSVHLQLSQRSSQLKKQKEGHLSVFNGIHSSRDYTSPKTRGKKIKGLCGRMPQVL